jgi:hypothetical protein
MPYRDRSITIALSEAHPMKKIKAQEAEEKKTDFGTILIRGLDNAMGGS